MKLVILSRHSPDNIEVKLKNSVGRAAQQCNQVGKHPPSIKWRPTPPKPKSTHVPPYVKYSMQYITGIVH